MSLIYAYKERGITRDVTILDADGATITPGDGDLVRTVIGRDGEAPVLTVTSGSPTDNGSSFSKGETNRLRLDAADLDFDPGTYTLTVEFFDYSDAGEWKVVEKQCFHLE